MLAACFWPTPTPTESPNNATATTHVICSATVKARLFRPIFSIIDMTILWPPTLMPDRVKPVSIWPQILALNNCRNILLITFSTQTHAGHTRFKQLLEDHLSRYQKRTAWKIQTPLLAGRSIHRPGNQQNQKTDES